MCAAARRRARTTRRSPSVAVTTYADATAVTGTRYYYAVRAVDAAGNLGNPSPESSAIAVDNGGVTPPAAFDGTFESGTDGASLTPAWTLSGTPQRAEYDTARAKNGTLSGWIQGPTTAAAAGASVPAVMTSNGAEYRFWMYADTANENRYVSDTGSVFELRTDTTGKLLVYTKRTATGYTANAYTQVGTYAVGWTEYRVVLDFTTDTYTLSTRTTAGGTWTQLKSATAPTYAIPMREATDRTTTANLLFRGYRTPTCGSTTCASQTPASSTCSAPTPSPPRPVPAARSHLSAPARSPTAIRRPTPSRRTPATRSPRCSSTASRSAVRRPTRSPT